MKSVVAVALMCAMVVTVAVAQNSGGYTWGYPLGGSYGNLGGSYSIYPSVGAISGWGLTNYPFGGAGYGIAGAGYQYGTGYRTSGSYYTPIYRRTIRRYY